MGGYLNVRKLASSEFKKEFRKLHGREPLDEAVGYFKNKIDLSSVQQVVDNQIAEKPDPSEATVIRKYHRNNLRYLARYFAETFSNQLKSAKLTVNEGLHQKDVIEHTIKTFKSNPQCKVYH